jgi:hypothetical protein
VTDVLNACIVAVAVSCLISQVTFDVFYWRRIIPLRTGSGIFAPPIRITLGYHLVVTGIVANGIYGTLLRIAADRAPSPSSIIYMALVAVLNVIVWGFYTFYLVGLRTHQA